MQKTLNIPDDVIQNCGTSNVLHTSITVLGSGLTALSAAIALVHKHTINAKSQNECHNNLQNYDDYITLLSAKPLKPSNDIRNIALTADTKHFFEEIKLWSKIEPHIAPLKDVYVVDNQSEHMLQLKGLRQTPGADPQILEHAKEYSAKQKVGSILRKAISKFGKSATKNTYLSLAHVITSSILLKPNDLGYMIPYHCLYNALLEYTQQLNSKKQIAIVEQEYEICKDPLLDKYFINFEQNNEFKHMNSDLILIAEGANSPTRAQYLDCADYYHSHDQTALVFNILHTQAHDNTAIEHFTTTGTFAVLPTSDQYASSVVWCLKSDLYKAYLKPEGKKLLEDMIYDFAGLSYGEIKLDSEIFSYPLYTYVAGKYFESNLALLGDSAHTIHPLAGLGFNQAVKDINSLYKLLDAPTLRDECTSILHQYCKARKVDNLSTALRLTSIDIACNSYSKSLKLLRHAGLKGINWIQKLINSTN